MPVNAVQTKDFRPRPLGDLQKMFANKVPLTSKQFDTLTAEQRARAFRIIVLNKVALIQRIQDDIGRALRDGVGFRDLQNNIQQMFAQAGIGAPSSHYLRLAMRQNMMTTYNVAKKRAGERPVVKQAFPYWMYLTAQDSRVRPEHAALNGKIFAKADPIWLRMYPPFGWNCRCTVRDVTEREAKRAGAAVEKNGAAFVRDKGITIPEAFDFPRDQLLDREILMQLTPALRKFVEKRFDEAKQKLTGT
jgi:SPP1 gp7 family putative phage head morphogenesis protein